MNKEKFFEKMSEKLEILDVRFFCGATRTVFRIYEFINRMERKDEFDRNNRA